MSSNEGIRDVSPCYFFKSQLLEYAQKVGFPKPVYETIKGGPLNRPSFRSTVIVNDVRYASFPGFSNRKAAEQSAAEVALKEIANRGELNQRISQPHETGLCKNVLQGYALKMKYGTPSYNCRMEEKPGGVVVFSCTVEVGGTKFIGSAARTKKEAEVSAARIALSAIQASVSGPSDAGTSAYTVVPRKKRATDSGISTQETVLKPRKVSLKKKQRRKRQRGRKSTNLNVGGMGNADASMDHVGAAAEDGTPTAREFYGAAPHLEKIYLMKKF